MLTPVELPFENNKPPLLHTAHEIRSCPDVLKRRSAKKVVALNDKVVAKIGGAIDVAEGQALIFLERHAPDVPSPRLHAMFRDANDVFLVMGRASGMQPDAVWPSLTDSEKSSVTLRLSHILDSMWESLVPMTRLFFLDVLKAGAYATTYSTVRKANTLILVLPMARELCRWYGRQFPSSG